jgi:hypothetical protein
MTSSPASTAGTGDKTEMKGAIRLFDAEFFNFYESS